MSKGKLFVISGASGVGKSTVLAKVMAKREDLRFSVSATTRKPRPGEIEGDTSEEQMRIRLDRASWEMEQAKRYDYVVINEQVETCAEQILHIIAEQADK